MGAWGTASDANDYTQDIMEAIFPKAFKEKFMYDELVDTKNQTKTAADNKIVEDAITKQFNKTANPKWPEEQQWSNGVGVWAVRNGFTLSYKLRAEILRRLESAKKNVEKEGWFDVEERVKSLDKEIAMLNGDLYRKCVQTAGKSASWNKFQHAMKSQGCTKGMLCKAWKAAPKKAILKKKR